MVDPINHPKINSFSRLSGMELVDTPLPTLDEPRVVVPAPGTGPGNWAGAASAVLVDGTTYLAYRVRRPLPDGRGVATVVVRSQNGVDFEPVCEVYRDEFGAESFERPVAQERYRRQPPSGRRSTTGRSKDSAPNSSR